MIQTHDGNHPVVKTRIKMKTKNQRKNMSNMLKEKVSHTPTPWTQVSNNKTLIVSDSNGEHITDCLLSDNGEANAEYIIKCVNMHPIFITALKIARKYIDDTPNAKMEHIEDATMIDRILKKAGAE